MSDINGAKKKNHYTVVNKDYWSAFYKKNIILVFLL